MWYGLKVILNILRYVGMRVPFKVWCIIFTHTLTWSCPEMQHRCSILKIDHFYFEGHMICVHDHFWKHAVYPEDIAHKSTDADTDLNPMLSFFWLGRESQRCTNMEERNDECCGMMLCSLLSKAWRCLLLRCCAHDIMVGQLLHAARSSLRPWKNDQNLHLVLSMVPCLSGHLAPPLDPMISIMRPRLGGYHEYKNC